MVQLKLHEEQVLELIRQLPSEQKRQVLRQLAEEAAVDSDRRMQHIEGRLRVLAAGRGLDWDKLSEEQRLAFTDDLIHEDDLPRL